MADPPAPTPEREPSDTEVSPWAIVWTTVICALFASLGHGVLWWAYATGRSSDVPWQPVTGIALVIVEIASFGGFYLASRRARVAIASSFLLTFLVSLSYVLTLQGLAEATQVEGAKDLFDDFRNIVTVIIGFYFGTEAAISVSKVIGVSRSGTATDIRRADRDLVGRPPSTAS